MYIYVCIYVYIYVYIYICIYIYIYIYIYIVRAQQTHDVNTTLYNVVILQRCENYIPATLLQRKLQRWAATCTQRCEITL